MPATAIAWVLAYTGGALAALADPFFALLVYLLDYYAHPPIRWWGKGLPDLRWSLLAAGILLVTFLLKRGNPFSRSTLRHAQTKWLLAFLLVSLLVTGLAVSPERSIQCVGDLAKLVLLFFLISGTVRTKAQFRFFVLAMILGSLLWGVNTYFDPSMEAGRLRKVGGPDSFNDNSAAAHLLTVLPFLGITLLSGTWLERGLSLLAAPLVLKTLILCNSRGATVALGVAALAGIVLAGPRFRLKVAVLLIVGSGIALSFADRSFVDRQVTLMRYGEDGSAMGRIDAWKGAIRLMGDYPLGAGGEGFNLLSPIYIPEVVAEHGGEERSVHSTFLAVGADWGVLGLSCFLGFLVASFLTLHRIRRETTDRDLFLQSYALELSLIGFLTASIFIVRVYADILYWLAALTVALRNIQQTPAEEASR